MKTSFLTAALSFLLMLASHAQVVFSLNKSNYAPGEAITATWSGRTTPSSTDWVGIYPRGVTPGSVASTIWNYTSGTKSATATLPAGSVTFNSPGLAIREWTAFFLANDGYSVLASFPFSVSNVSQINGFTADHVFINDGSPITLSWVVDPGSGGLQTLTLSDGTMETNVTGLDLLEVSPIQNTTYTLTLNGNITARASVFKDAGNTASFNLGTATHFSSSEAFTAHWDGTTGNPDSWIGIYRIGHTPGPNGATYWNYLNGSKTPGGPNRPAGSLDFDPAPGEYYAVLFTNGGYTAEQGPIRFSVLDQEIKPFAATGFVQDGGDWCLSWNSLPGEFYDILTSTDLLAWELTAENIRASSLASKVFLPTAADEPRCFFTVRRRAAP